MVCITSALLSPNLVASSSTYITHSWMVSSQTLSLRVSSRLSSPRSPQRQSQTKLRPLLVKTSSMRVALLTKRWMKTSIWRLLTSWSNLALARVQIQELSRARLVTQKLMPKKSHFGTRSHVSLATSRFIRTSPLLQPSQSTSSKFSWIKLQRKHERMKNSWLTLMVRSNTKPSARSWTTSTSTT